MLEKDTIIKVTNRDTSYVGYCVPELNNLRRRFAPGETKEVTMQELRALSWTRGGFAMIQNHLIIHNSDAVKEILPDAEPEYYYGVSEVEELLQHGSLDAFMDALDFAPEGVISLIKEKAVELKLNDVSKREAILNKTGFDVTKAIEYNLVAPNTKNETLKRRVGNEPKEVVEESTPEAPVRRTAAPKYTVISK